MYAHTEIAIMLDSFDMKLTTIPGVGVAIASKLIAKIGDISCVKNADKLALFTGIAPVKCSSVDKGNHDYAEVYKVDRQEAMNIMQLGSRNDKLDYLNDLDTAFDTYNRNVANSNEVIDVLINFALISKDDEITYELLEVICSAQATQNLGDVDFSKIADNLNNVSEKFLPRYIDILSYTNDDKYLPIILSFKNHSAKDVQQAVEDALIELRTIDNR